MSWESSTLDGIPTIVNEGGGFAPMGAREGVDGSIEDVFSTYLIKPDGTVKVTGPWVRYMTLAQLCMRAPNIAVCNE